MRVYDHLGERKGGSKQQNTCSKMCLHEFLYVTARFLGDMIHLD